MTKTMTKNKTKTLISVEALRDLTQQETTIVIVDCRFSLMDATIGKTQYSTSHIPGAVYADLNEDLSSPVIAGVTGRHPLPERQKFVSTVRQLGIHNRQLVIAYDADNGAYAARLWWLLRWLGHDQVVVLDGGFAAWQAGGLPTSKPTQRRREAEPGQSLKQQTSEFEAADPLVNTITAADLLHTNYSVTDARDAARFRGEVEPVDPIAGHIPGAVCLPFSQNMNPTGTFKSAQELRSQFLSAGLDEHAPTICYCGSGVTACHNAIALIHAGFPEPVLYPGSWSEWITDASRPIVTGE
ncbi:MAG: thiosulfate/3-mercaptopyruvate sulfurtransferase [Candidatus Azotimanducaceae bacterium]|jgi:thiosulfate/3-mercaptopyruvate sulfurtransferase